jgi:predicted nucleic acid-binding protein
MILVIDANCVIAALIKNNKSREIIISHKFDLVSPDYLLDEINKYL